MLFLYGRIYQYKICIGEIATLHGTFILDLSNYLSAMLFSGLLRLFPLQSKNDLFFLFPKDFTATACSCVGYSSVNLFTRERLICEINGTRKNCICDPLRKIKKRNTAFYPRFYFYYIYFIKTSRYLGKYRDSLEYSKELIFCFLYFHTILNYNFKDVLKFKWVNLAYF